MSSYPPHLTDKIRVAIALEVTKKEIRKLYPSLDENMIKKIEKDIDNFAKFTNDIAICNFWDIIYAYNFEMMRKEWFNYLTAENVIWTSEQVPIDTIQIEWTELGDPKLMELGQPPYSTERINNWLDKNPEYRKRQLENSDRHSQSTLMRDHYPIILVKKGDAVTVEDGNRRILRAILYGKHQLPAYVGQINGNQINNYWIATGVMRHLVLTAERAGAGQNEHIFAAYKQIFDSFFTNSSTARINYSLRVASRYFGQRSPLAKRFL